MQLNLHELINAPGYGKANDAVKKAGHWNEERALFDGKPRRVKIEVTGYVVETETYTVTASSAEEAYSEMERLCFFKQKTAYEITKVEEPQS